MNNILENIVTQIGAAHLIVNRNALTRENCRADLTGLPTNRVVVDMDAVFPSGQYSQKQCDYVVFFLNTSEDTCFAVPIRGANMTVETTRCDVNKNLAAVLPQSSFR